MTDCKIFHGDCLELLKQGTSDAIDAIITDPPAGIGFMGKGRDANEILDWWLGMVEL